MARDMAQGVRLTLMVGPAAPLPVPPVVLDALQRVEVQSPSGDTQAGFELTFTVPKRSPLETLFLLAGGTSIPLVRVVIAVTVGGQTSVLMDGVMTHHEMRPGAGGGRGSLVVKGKDLTHVMDLLEVDGLPYPAMPSSLRVLSGVAKYAAFGVRPMVIPAVVEDIPIPVDRIPRQQGTDYQYFRHLATQAGYVFYLDPGPWPGMSRAYWGPELRVGAPQPALSMDMDAHTNVESLAFRFDQEAKEMPVVMVQNPATKAPIPIPIPDLSPLNPPLGAVPPLPPRLKMLTDTAKQNPAQAVMTGLAHAARHQDSVTATGTLNVTRYGHVLKSRGLVGVRGGGAAFDGLYYVKQVTHRIERGDYQQEFTLARNGLLPTVSAVPA